MRLLAVVALAFLLVSPAGAVQIIPASQDSWTCYDYAINFAKENPDWGIVTISENQWFRGVSHMVNYQISGSDFYIHDGFYGIDCVCENWSSNFFYYHFWTDGTPVRNYRVMQDNRKVMM